MFGRRGTFFLLVVYASVVLSSTSEATFFEWLLRGGCGPAAWDHSQHVLQSDFEQADRRAQPFLWLATSLKYEGEYEPRIEGKIPEEIDGTLYRNGPGIFDRGGLRKRAILDGDGKIQRLRISNGKAVYSTRFVMTRKYMDEEREGRFLYRTWSTNSPVGWTHNLGINLGNQAGVTVIRRGSELFALDEVARPYKLNVDTLETLGEAIVNAEKPNERYQAHTKIDAGNGQWFLYSLEFGKTAKLRITQVDADNRVKVAREVALPRTVYMHDWAVTENYFIFILHPVYLPGREIFKTVLGQQAIIDAIKWRPEEGNLVLLIPRHTREKEIVLHGNSAWLWHVVNAYESDGEVKIDFIGSSNPALGEAKSDDDPMFGIMRGRVPTPVSTASHVRRYIVRPSPAKLTEIDIASGADFELPTTASADACRNYRFGYACQAQGGLINANSIARIDVQTQNVDGFNFGPGQFVSEPIHIPSGPGYLATEVLDGVSGRSYIAILRADEPGDGPVAKIWLDHHVPLSFHGTWHNQP